MIYLLTLKFVNCIWVVTGWQKYSTHLQTNNTYNDTKHTMYRATQQFCKSADPAPSWLNSPLLITSSQCNKHSVDLISGLLFRN